jgi:hypothetical protein
MIRMFSFSYPGSGSRGQKTTGSRIRIRNTSLPSNYLETASFIVSDPIRIDLAPIQ